MNYTKSMWWRTRWRSFKHVTILCQFSICASVNTSEIFCCFSTGLRFFGGFLGSFSWTKQNLVGIDPGFTLAQEEPGFFVKHSALKWSLHILECSFTGVFVRRIFARHLDSNYLFCSGKRRQDFLTSAVGNTPVKHCETKRRINHNYWIFLLDRKQTTRSVHHQTSLSCNQKRFWRHHA